MKLKENSATSFRFLFPRKNSSQEMSRFSTDMILLKVWRSLTLSLSLSLDNTSILNRIKEGYLIWISIAQHIPRSSRYTIGARIENKFLDLLEISYIAYFTEKERKMEKITQCILCLDTIKFLLYVIWEAKLISHKHYTEISEKIVEIGKMFGGWKKGLENKTLTR
jgi:uncharacterized membrane protein